MKLETWLVTGGAGFIGGNFVLKHAGRSARIINLDALTYAGNLHTLQSLHGNDDHIFVQGDIANRTLLEHLFAEYQPTAVLNFAAESHVDRSIDGPGAFIQTNVLGSFTLLEATLGFWRSLAADAAAKFRFLHISTDEVYGSLGDTGKFTETTAYAPNSPYSASKAASDHLVRAFHHTYGLPTLTTNCSNNYGPYQFPEKLIPLMITKALSGAPLPVYGDGKNVRDWLYVGDHVSAIAAVLQSGRIGEVYNVGGDAERENIAVVHALCGIVDRLQGRADAQSCAQQITYVKDRPGHDRRYAIDSSKLQRETGWRPSESFESGLEKTVRWYLDNQQWVNRVLDGSYRGERLGASKTAADAACPGQTDD
jgi:dTDP-glucose 4,6-dehydratase